MHFTIYGRWDFGSVVTPDVEARFAGELRPTDESVCVWSDPDDQRLLRVGFDVEASGLEEALDAGRAEIVTAALRVPLEGRLDELVSMSEEGYRSWTA